MCGPDAVERVQQRLFEAAAETQALVFSQIVQECSQALLESDRYVHALDLNWRSCIEEMLSEPQLVAVEIADPIVAQTVRPVTRRLDNVDSVGALKFVELVRVPDDEIHGTAGWIGRPLFKEHLHIPQVHSGDCRWVTPREPQPKSELVGVEVDGRTDVAHRQGRMLLFALDFGDGRSAHEISPRLCRV